MDIYLETNINLLVRLSKEAHAQNTDAKRYVTIAKGISEILNTIEKTSWYAMFTLCCICYNIKIRSCIRTIKS